MDDEGAWTRREVLRAALLAGGAVASAPRVPAGLAPGRLGRRASRAAGGAGDSVTLRSGTMLTTASLDPLLGLGGSAVAAIYDALSTLDPRTHAVGPALARSWRAVSPTETDFDLDPSAAFSNGSAVTPLDVTFSIGTVLGSASPLGGLLSTVVRVVATGSATVRVVTRAPDPLLAARLAAAPVLSQAAYVRNQVGSPAALVGSGRYVASAFQPGGSLELVASPRPWRGAPPVAHLALSTWATQDGLLGALSDGRIDLAQDLPASAAGELDGRCAVRLSGIGQVSYLLLDTLRPPFDDPAVRRAVALALDLSALAGGVLRGAGSPLAGQLAPPGCTGYVPGLAPLAHDPAAARALLAGAGHERGLSTVLAGPSSAGPLLDALATQLAGADIDAAPARLDDVAWQREVRAGTRHPMLLGVADVAPLFDVGPAYAVLTGRGVPGRPSLAGAVLDRLDAEQAVELDAARRELLLREMALSLRDELPLVPLFAASWYYGWWPYVSGLSTLGPTLVLPALRLTGAPAGPAS